uniref:Uncharacterized protein n=1 Tax=Knipowitschia caucasica TaxID=637954 RepID=A0AAV2MHE5_KNICA
MVVKRNCSRSGAGGKGTTLFKYFPVMDVILGQRPIVTSLNTVLNSIGNEEEEEDPDVGALEEDMSHDLASFEDNPPATPPNPPSTSVAEDEVGDGRSGRWRCPRSRRSSLQSVLREPAQQDNAVLNNIAQVLARAMDCFERSTAAAERHASALEALVGRHKQPHPTPNYQQHPQAPYFHQHHPPAQHPQFTQPQQSQYQHQAMFESEPATSSQSHSPSYQTL